MTNIVDTFLEIELKNPDDFNKIRETLTRIGYASRVEKTLYQSCHILHKKGKYYIVHFKELFLLDGKTADFSENDLDRRNTIASLLEEWGLLKIKSKSMIEGTDQKQAMNQIKIVSFKDKPNWKLVPKYTIGISK